MALSDGVAVHPTNNVVRVSNSSSVRFMVKNEQNDLPPQLQSLQLNHLRMYGNAFQFYLHH